MYHSIDFGDKNTWESWHLIPTSRPVVAPPKQKTKIVDIPGGSGVIDLSESLTGYPVFNNRTGSFEFLIVNNMYAEANDTTPSWVDVYTDITKHLHGKTMKMVLEDDPDYYYEGRFAVDQWNSDKTYSKITISYDVGPYKWYKKDFTAQINVTSENYVWTINKSTNHIGDVPFTPTIIISDASSDGVSIQFVNPNLGIDVTQGFNNGTYKASRMTIYGDEDMTFTCHAESGTAKVKFIFKEGYL